MNILTQNVDPTKENNEFGKRDAMMLPVGIPVIGLQPMAEG
jgi:hypothetical protein